MDRIKRKKTLHASYPRRRLLRHGAPWLLAAGLAIGCAPAFANVSLVSYVQGWVNSRGGSNEAGPINGTFTGNDGEMRINSWVAFWVPAGTYTSATLSVTPSYSGNPGPCVIGLFDVSTPLSTFSTFKPGISAYGDLGGGRQYASAVMGDQPISIPLNGRALADINSTTGRFFLIGFTNQTMNAKPLIPSWNGIYINGTGRTLMRLELGTADQPSSTVVPLAEPPAR